ncbi:hypothetical protein AA0113_g1389 [Alternaria arborescens]|uniref:Uncharacterized protein n=1 Tax=Alternaria arborescens TaxID=156630 RepID=A0A4Q4SPJ9_9PLEO|nr:hypothetical protein AA0111_g6203 [Alternaria arborescens]RYO29043.1 hypothetical protein AA0111_g6203 [Alternaria arborescens]RYO72226.1 hypothetical protein AA0113_g1389 [Alternaria arborescens]
MSTDSIGTVAVTVTPVYYTLVLSVHVLRFAYYRQESIDMPASSLSSLSIGLTHLEGHQQHLALSQSPPALISPYAPSSPLYWNLLAVSPTSQANQVAHHNNSRAWPVPQVDIAPQKPPSPGTAPTSSTKSPAWNLLQAANYPQTTPLHRFFGLAKRLPAICRPSSCLYKPPSPTTLTPSPHSLHEIDSLNQVHFQHHGLTVQTLAKIS